MYKKFVLAKSYIDDMYSICMGYDDYNNYQFAEFGVIESGSSFTLNWIELISQKIKML